MSTSSTSDFSPYGPASSSSSSALNFIPGSSATGPASSPDGGDYSSFQTYPTGTATPGSSTSNAPSSSDDGSSKNTLWMGELEPWMDESAIRKIWANFGESVNVKLIRDKFTGSNAGYCFVEFSSPAAAANALLFNGQPIPNSQRALKLNWASGGGLSDKRDDKGPEYSIFVGDLAPEVSELNLLLLFQSRYQSAKSAKIMTDPQTSASRGYGFVRFTDESEMQRALTEMQGFYCGPRPMRISTATPKSKTATTGTMNPPNSTGAAPSLLANNSSSSATSASSTPNSTGAFQKIPVPSAQVTQQQLPQQFAQSIANQPGNGGGFYGMAPGSTLNQHNDPNNTTVFVGGLSSTVTEDELRHYFSGFGDITYVKIPTGKGCGFVQYVQRQSAEAAITQMQGYPIGNSRVRLSWGRSQNSSGNMNGPSSNGNNTSSSNNNNMALNQNTPLIGSTPSAASGLAHLGGFPTQQHYNLASTQPYRQGPPPSIYPQMTIPPQAQQFSPFGPLNARAAHLHPQQQQPLANGAIANGDNTAAANIPGAVSSSSRNSLFMAGVPPQIGSGPGAGSGSLATAVPGQDPSEPIPVARLNELYLAARDGRLDRVEGDGRGYHGVYAQ
ncbi:uncharacterized protein SAPINGB_P004466 [Magnusiomyces paraingens]|uniref:RRM domain-containing protein n=1 Tax=Magnusiomyces paraingens TaxID=2606893 RepID=A0A5E8BTY6_9ASCO|nr:uncharacterized protein SAPINGB_P004466 [Saprochaete ingens]VVT55178.1 unnamed protein product [Saprochaete ingens]